MTIVSKPAFESPLPKYTRFPSRLTRTSYKIYNYLDNSLYPVRPLYFGAATAAAAAFYAKQGEQLIKLIPDFTGREIEKYVRISIVSLLTAYTPVFLTRAVLRHFYFKYRGWFTENPKKPSFTTKIWGVVRWLVSLAPPRFMSCDSLLQSPPVPDLNETVERYLTSMRPLHSTEEMEAIETMAEEFLDSDGVKLQRFTRLYSLFVENYVTGFWEKFAYHRCRSSLLINSTVSNIDTFELKPVTQARRAAHVVYVELHAALALEQQQIKPLSDGFICSRHFNKIYSITRVPGETIDHLKKYEVSPHFVIIFRGGLYKLNAVDERGNVYTPDQLQDIFLELFNRPNTKVEGAASRIPALTVDDRTNWHKNRRRFFEKIPKNARALDIIERSILVISLEDHDHFGNDPANPDILSNFMKAILTGNGANSWTDKCLNYQICKNGRLGGTGEHSTSDGCELDTVGENLHVMENFVLGFPPIEEQLERERTFDVAKVDKSIRFAERIEIDVDEEMASEIDRCYTTHLGATADLQMASLVYRNWGKGRIKKCKCSPDGFFQMAVQLANYRDQGRFVLTYEPASARFYKNSRTETIRSVTDRSCDFVRAMCEKERDTAKCVKLLQSACELHVANSRDCMMNKGVDRHLFVLYVMSQALGVTSPFLDHYVQQEWLLSTSNVPLMTGKLDEEIENGRYSWLGGGFGPVAKRGYGVCYRFAGDHSICMHITSFHSAGNTDAERFRGHLVRALEEMSALFA